MILDFDKIYSFTSDKYHMLSTTTAFSRLLLNIKGNNPFARVQSTTCYRCCAIVGMLVVLMWGMEVLPGKGGRGRHRDVQDRTPTCLLHKPHRILLPQLLRRTQGAERCAPSGVTMPCVARAFSH